MKIFVRYAPLVLAALFFASCNLLGGGDDTPTYVFKATVSPAGGGTVSPDSASFEEGETVTAQASAASGFLFDGWSGDISSADNPLSFEITEDTDVRANFTEIDSRYWVDMTVADNTDSMILSFGQQNGATDGFDSGLDEESPPAPPQGALHSYFSTGGLELLSDFRDNNDVQVSWDMQYQMGSGSILQLSWQISSSLMPGTLILRNADSSINVNMMEVSSVDVPAGQTGSLIIEYEVAG